MIAPHRLAGAPFNTQREMSAAFETLSPVRNPYIAPPGCVTMTSGLDALPALTAAMTPA